MKALLTWDAIYVPEGHEHWIVRRVAEQMHVPLVIVSPMPTEEEWAETAERLGLEKRVAEKET